MNTARKQLRFGAVVGLALIAAVPLLNRATWNGFTLREWWRETHSGVVLWHAQTAEKVVALTFDDGPDPRYTPRVVDILQRYGIHATFFMEGRLVDASPAIARLVVAHGHCVGNHTYTHPYITRLSPRRVREEIAKCAHSLETQTGVHTFLMRPPRGDWNPAVFAAACGEQDHIILWSVALEHHEVHTPQAMAARALRLARPGAIILLHDGAYVSRETTVQALPLLIEGLRQRGYRCVTVPELLHIPGNMPAVLPSPKA